MSSPNQPYQEHHAVEAKGSGISVSQMLAAGMASVGAALFTSRFGVAGTLIGAGLTTMIITGGSAILKSYLDTLSGHVKSMPQRINTGRTRLNRSRAGRAANTTATVDSATRSDASEGMAVYGRGRDGGRGFFGKLGSAFGWFRRLPGSRKRRVILGAAIPAVIAFVVAMGAITSVEVVSGRTLSCLTGGVCQTATGASGATANTTFGEIASRAGGSSGGAAQPFENQLEPPSLAPEQQVPSDGSGAEGDSGGGFFEQPSGTEVPDGSVQPVVPSEDGSGVAPEVPTEVQPSEVEPAPVQ
ncbi:hypothetical protein [Rubrobacter indicoceani]|uniref:hypothetical protein n=1 Tax=Rubrobacter indicoceani TaxID=2051957 RepID=UPI0013C4108A|nr:hypothetical protein [Rubrobacter indicoceani]